MYLQLMIRLGREFEVISILNIIIFVIIIIIHEFHVPCAHLGVHVNLHCHLRFLLTVNFALI